MQNFSVWISGSIYIYMYMCIAKNMLMDPCNRMPRAPDAIKTLSKRKYNPDIL